MEFYHCNEPAYSFSFRLPPSTPYFTGGYTLKFNFYSVKSIIQTLLKDAQQTWSDDSTTIENGVFHHNEEPHPFR